MKKLFYSFLLLLTISTTAFAAKRGVLMRFHNLDHLSNYEVDRSLSTTSIDAFYDDETRTIEFVCDETVDAEIYLCTQSGEILAQTTAQDGVLYVPADLKGTYKILVMSGTWYADGDIII